MCVNMMLTRKTQIFDTHLYLTSPIKLSRRNLATIFRSKKKQNYYYYLHYKMCKHTKNGGAKQFETNHECDGHTDRRTKLPQQGTAVFNSNARYKRRDNPASTACPWSTNLHHFSSSTSKRSIKMSSHRPWSNHLSFSHSLRLVTRS